MATMESTENDEAPAVPARPRNDEERVWCPCAPPRNNRKKERRFILAILLLAIFLLVWDGSLVASTSSRATSTKTAAENTTTSTASNDFMYNEFSELQRATIDFVQSRRAAFEQQGMGLNWWMRGLGYLWDIHNIALALHIENPVVVVVDSNSEADGVNKDSPNKPSPIQVHIMNVHKNATGQDCDKLSIWVRVRGPEIVAGTAMPIFPTTTTSSSEHCYWVYKAHVRAPGEYTVDAKVLTWNAKGVQPSTMRCETTTAAITEGQPWNDEAIRANLTQSMADNRILSSEQQYPHSGFKGFKLYGPATACCEYCSRLPGCIYWATPAFKLQQPSLFHNGCEFFFNATNTPSIHRHIPKSHLLHDLNTTWNTNEIFRRRLGAEAAHGLPHTGQKVWFVGCGWSQFFTLDFPCLSGDLDDKVFALNNTFTILQTQSSNNHSSSLKQQKEQPKQVPITQTNDTITAVDTASDSSDEQNNRPLCELEDEFDGSERGRWVQEPWPNETECPPFAYDPETHSRFKIIQWTGDKPHCWHRDDLSSIGENCVEINCKHIRDESRYRSELRVSQWMGVWRDWECDYYEYTDRQLQQCFNAQKVQSIKPEGRSISEYIYEYVKQRISPLQLYNGTDDDDAVTIVISTLGLLHMSTLSHDEVRERLSSLPNATANEKVKRFIPNPMFISSERETLALQENVAQINDIAMELLPAKGYAFFNALEASTPWTFDTATQFDGMHLIGPPMKLIVTKFFHYLCKDYVEGSRM